MSFSSVFFGAVSWVHSNPEIVAGGTAVFSVVIHAAAKKWPRLVAASQAVSIDLPKLWAALFGPAPAVALPPADGAPTHRVVDGGGK